MERSNVLESDVVIIGSGITGAALARELSKYKVETILVERAGAVCQGQSKVTQGSLYYGIRFAGSLILKSFALPDGTPLLDLYDPERNVIKWCEQGFKEWPSIFEELEVKYRFLPDLYIATGKEQIEALHAMRDLSLSIAERYGKEKFRDFREVDKKEMLDLEPAVSENIDEGIYAPDDGIDVFNPELVIALTENAAQNGVKIMLDAEVTGISKNGDYQTVTTSSGSVKTKFIINAAGRYAHIIADMGGYRDWNLEYWKSPLVILDRKLDGLINGVVRRPLLPGKMRTILPRDKNLMVQCGTYEKCSQEDTGIVSEDVLESVEMARELLPAISKDHIITGFGGVRLFNTRDIEKHLIEFPPDNPKFLNAVIRMPGFTGAPPMCRHIVSMLGNAGLELVSKTDFNPRRKAIPRFRDLNNNERDKLIAKDSRYGRIICRCETVTEGEIVEAIKRGARTLDGVKFRTRAGMGRCQTNYCGHKVASIIARELDLPLEAVTKKGVSSKFAA